MCKSERFQLQTSVLVDGFEGVDVGNRLRVQLVSVNVQQGFIDFKNVNGSNH